MGSIWGGCIEGRQMTPTSLYILHLLQLFVKTVRMFVLLIPSHIRLGKCPAGQTRPTSYITNLAQSSLVVSESSNFFTFTACIVYQTSRFVRQPSVSDGINCNFIIRLAY